MRPLEALDKARMDAGLSRASLAKSMGRSDSYIRQYYARGQIPSVDTYVMMLDACDCDLVIRNRTCDNEILVTRENDDSVEAYLD